MKKPRLATLVKRYVDQTGTLLVLNGKLGIEVTILDVRIVYGRTEFAVEPVHGHGEAWVESKGVHF